MGRGGEWLKWGVLTSQERYPNIVNYTRDSDAQRETHRRWSPLINSNTFLRSTTGSNFLKLINNLKSKDKGNHAPWRVWISDEKLLVFASLISPSKSVCLRSYVKHSSQCFITISKTSKFVKNTSLRVVFSTLFSAFDMRWKTVSCLIYYLEDGSHKQIQAHLWSYATATRAIWGEATWKAHTLSRKVILVWISHNLFSAILFSAAASLVPWCFYVHFSLHAAGATIFAASIGFLKRP